jgi:hypothetical protein
MEDKDNYSKSKKKEFSFNEPPNEQTRSLTTTIDSLSIELEGVKKSLQKRKSENTKLKILFYTGLLVLLLGFLYSNSVLQRAHMRSLEKNIISLEQRLTNDIIQVEMNLELDTQETRKLKLINGPNIFKILERMDFAISQLNPKKEKISALINQVLLDTSEFSQLLKNQPKNPKLN